MTNGIERTEAFRIAHKKVETEKRRQSEILHGDCPQNFREERAGEAFNLGFSSTEAIDEEISKHPRVFVEINALATKKVISYEDAEEKLREAADPDLISKVKKYQNSNKPKQAYPKEPGPPKIYRNRHKARGGKTRREVIRIYENWVNGGKRPKFDISEKATPLDEYPEFILFGDEVLK